MPLSKEIKNQIIEEFSAENRTSGDAEVQIAIMHKRIGQITEHLKTNKKDFHSRKGLTMLVGKRRKLEGYLKEKDITKYRELIQRLGIREVKKR